VSKSLLDYVVCRPSRKEEAVEPSSVVQFPRLDQFVSMSHRVSALSSILRSPARILGIVLMLVFTAEIAVMFLLPHLFPGSLGEFGKAVLDAVLLTLVCAPALWWVIIGPLRRIAIQEHQRSETIVAHAGESILTFDSDGSIVSCNRATMDLFGVGAEQLIGKSMRLAIPDLLERVDQLPSEFRVDALRTDGQQFPVHVSVSEYPSETQTLRIAIIRDLTQSQQAEHERLTMARETEALRAQQMATLAQLATGVAHEIRNPLTSIKMLIQVNRDKFAEQGLPTDDMELVEQEIRRMERSVNSLLDYARPEASEFAKFAIADVVRRTIRLVDGRCRSQNVAIEVETPSEPIFVFGDPAQIQQLLLNLILNALDSMPAGGKLKLAVRTAAAQVEVTVSDTGTGIDDAVVGRLFAPFVTTKPNGVGLGLGICRRIAESHRGQLSGSNLVSGGAQFQLTLPLSAQDSAAGSDLPISGTSCKAC
jgi:PAS domain S-box-containing protein